MRGDDAGGLRHRLQLYPQATHNTAPLGTAFTISVDGHPEAWDHDGGFGGGACEDDQVVDRQRNQGGGLVAARTYFFR